MRDLRLPLGIQGVVDAGEGALFVLLWESEKFTEKENIGATVSRDEVLLLQEKLLLFAL
jgi:hypothetical protein